MGAAAGRAEPPPARPAVENVKAAEQHGGQFTRDAQTSGAHARQRRAPGARSGEEETEKQEKRVGDVTSDICGALPNVTE